MGQWKRNSGLLNAPLKLTVVFPAHGIKYANKVVCIPPFPPQAILPMKARFLTATALILSTGFPSLAQAQVNTESVRGDASREGLSGRIEATFTGSTGNSEGIVAGGGGRLQYSHDPHLAFIQAKGNYSRLNNTTSVERALVHARYNYEVVSRIWGELFAQIEHDAFRRLANRELLGAGPRFQVVRTTTFDLFFGTSYMAEWENLNLTADETHRDFRLAHRWNNYLVPSASLSDRLEVGSTIYFQPRFDKLSDWRLLAESFMEVGITDVISARISSTVRHDSNPPNDVKKTDFSFTNALVAKF